MVKKKQRNSEIRLIIQELRRIIKRSEHSQREVEDLAGFSKGYLSQLLAGNLDLKVWHVLAILGAFEITPGDFFERIYPGRERQHAFENFAAHSTATTEDLEYQLATLQRAGAAFSSTLCHRLARCEQAIAELRAKGLIADDEGDQEAQARTETVKA